MKKTSARATGLAASLSLLAVWAAGGLQAQTAAPAEVPVLMASEYADLPPLLIAQPAEKDDTEAKTSADAEPVVTPAADVVEPVLPPPAAPGWTWALTGRVWTLWENDFFFQDENDDFQQSNEAIFIPFAGGSISATPGPGAPTFSLTVLYGEGSGEVRGQRQAFFIPPNIIVESADYIADVDVSRLDIEGIAQIPFADGFNWIVGGRFINFRRDEEGAFIGDITGTVTPAEFHLEQNFYLAEAGFGVNRPLGAGPFIAFGNLTFMLGFADVVDTSGDFGVFNLSTDDLQGGVFGVDTNAGLGYQLSPRALLSARYRLFYLTAPDFKFKTGGNFIHGPEFNLTFTF